MSARLRMNPEEPEWTSENLLKLFSAMKSNTPSGFMECSYTKGLKKVDWNRVAFHQFSPEACRLKWIQILKKMRRSRSLTELLVEAEDNIVIGPKVLKKPVPPSVMFFQVHNAMFKEQHPELAQKEIMRILSQKYKCLPEEEKAPYEKKYKCAYQQYRAWKQKLSKKGVAPPYIMGRRGKESEPVQTGTEAVEDLPPKPHFNAYILFCKEQRASMADGGKHNHAKVWSQRWQDLTDREKKNYHKRCRKLKKEYEVKLDKYPKTLTAAEQREYQDSKPVKHQFLKSGNKKTKGREALSPNRPSDSEDEDIEESSSSDDDDDDYVDCNEEGEEDITFQMY